MRISHGPKLEVVNIPAYFFAVIAVVAWLYIRAWEAGLLNWRHRRIGVRIGEQGEASVSLVVVILALIGAITLLLVLERDVPDVFSTSLSGAMLGFGTSELSIRRSEKRSAKKSSSRANHPSNT